MFNREEKLLLQVKEYIKNNPSSSTRFLDVISQGLKDFEESVKKSRDNLASNAISPLLAGLKYNKRFQKFGHESVPFLIDAMFYQFPKGMPTLHSQGERDAFIQFRDWCIEDDYITKHRDWVEQTKGKEYYEWMQKVVSYEKED